MSETSGSDEKSEEIKAPDHYTGVDGAAGDAAPDRFGDLMFNSSGDRELDNDGDQKLDNE